MLQTNRLAIAFYKFKCKHPRFVMATLVFVVIPLASGLILGYEMKADVPASIPTVIVNHDNSEFSRTFTGFIEDSNYFDVIEYTDRDERIKEKMDKNQAYAGIIIPENFYQDMRAGKAPNILTVYDGSALSVVTTSKTAMSEILLTTKAAYMMSIFEGKLSAVPEQVMNLVTPINVNYKFLYNSTKSFRNYLLIGMLASVIQVGIAMQGAERGYENQTKPGTYLNQLKVIGGWSVMSALSIILCLGVQYLFFDMPYRSTIVGGLLMTFLFAMCILNIGYIVGNIVPDRVFAIQISAILVLPASIVGGYTYPIEGMPHAFQALAKLIPYYYYGNDIRSLCLKELGIHHIAGTLQFFSVFILAELILILAIMLFKNWWRATYKNGVGVTPIV
ncbi:ABC transporter permease [Clostridium aminobutyricum]|uniref:ABC transporter permease n=1 Tax=Clostridium aminobutyricum TaxID=33953 RepID=A0A939D8P5_CLOAM|nr:ABC transporter permease [Clostridium aminobutyricum]MBN7773221.1 ABC transporter permease [Clostridium aminobutyricum]